MNEIEISMKATRQEKKRCIAWLEDFIEDGETDMREVINCINRDEWPVDLEDQDEVGDNY